MRLILLLVSATALQLQPRRDYIRGFNSAAPRAAPIATPPKGPVSVEFCPRRAVIAASFAFGASQLLPAKRAVALRPKRRVAAAPPPDRRRCHYRRRNSPTASRSASAGRQFEGPGLGAST